MKKEVPNWKEYAHLRNLSRNRLLFARHKEIVDEFLIMFGELSNDKKVLDIGPANGIWMVLLRELGFINLDGLEISPVFLDKLQSKGLTGFLGNITTGEGLLQLSPPYDIILMMEILEHLESPEQALRNAKSLLAKDGLLYLTIPFCGCIFSRLLQLKRRISRAEQIRNIDETHLHAFSKKELRELLKLSGFEIQKLKRVSFNIPKVIRSRFIRRVFLLVRALTPDCFRGMFLVAIAKQTNNYRK